MASPAQRGPRPAERGPRPAERGPRPDERGPRPLEKRLREAKKKAAREADEAAAREADEAAAREAGEAADRPGPADRKADHPAGSPPPGEPDMGDLIIVLLASTLAGLRDRLVADGYDGAAELVADMVEMADDYVMRAPGAGG